MVRSRAVSLTMFAQLGILADVCADCKGRNPRWASHNLGIFIWCAMLPILCSADR